jgi:hypothetical protein
MTELTPPNPTTERERAEQNVSRAIQYLKGGTQHPNYPPILSHHFDTLTASLRVLQDDNFDRRTVALTKRSTNPLLYRQREHQIPETLSVKDAFTFQPPLSPKKLVIVRSEYVANTPPVAVEWLLAEEFGHLSIQ